MIAIAVFCFISSLISGIAGMGGGILLMLTLAPLMDSSVLIPFHGIVQLVSNSFRSFLFRKEIDTGSIRYFIPSAVIGTATGFFLRPDLPEAEFKVILGISLAILSLLKIKIKSTSANKVFILPGILSGFLSVNIGATGPVIAPFFLLKKRTPGNLIGTKAVCQMSVHLAKTLLFLTGGFLGFTYLPDLAVALPSVFLGTFCGKKLVTIIPVALFRKGVRILIILLCLRLAWSGLMLFQRD